MIKKGDTLIEVTLAIGIFSMVAIAVVSVMSSGTSGAQTALETTLAREEIDSQAEALRFIHSSYLADKSSDNQRFSKLWQSITSEAVDISSLNADAKKQILQYSPSTCEEIYNGETSLVEKSFSSTSTHPFVINTHQLGNYSSVDKSKVDSAVKTVHVTTKNNSEWKKTFTEASTYPRLIFGSSTSNDGNDALATDDTGNTAISNRDKLYHAEGIYVLAVRDEGTTKLSNDNRYAKAQPAYFDFFIRTCWYGVGDKSPSTISTVMRLYDPDAIKIYKPETSADEEVKQNSTLQNVTISVLENDMPEIGKTTKYKDNRTDSYFSVGRLADDNYWMLSNLNIGKSKTPGKINNNNTNINTGTEFTLPSVINEGFNSYTTPQISVSGSNVYYNYCAASAGTFCYEENKLESKSPSSDICPKGWRLPTIDEFKNLYNKDKNTFKSRFKITNGEFYDKGLKGNGQKGFYWTSSYSDGSKMYRLGFNGDTVNTEDVQSRSYGSQIRCIFNK